MLVPRHRERAERPSGERVIEGHEPGAVLRALGDPVAPCELQTGLHRLGSAVAQERPRQTRECREASGDLRLQRVIVEV